MGGGRVSCARPLRPKTQYPIPNTLTSATARGRDIIGRSCKEGAAGDSSHKAGDSSHKPEDSSHTVTRHQAPWIPDLSEGDIKRLQEVAYPGRMRSRVRNQDEMRRAILAVCKGRFLTLRQLARVVGRNPQGIHSRYLSPLVRQGKLRMLYEQEPNRPDQAYTTVEVG